MPAGTDLPKQFGRYHIVKKLGTGGMGTVYLAEDSLLGRRIALKVPHFEEEEDSGAPVVERFYREARLAAGIIHPNLCSVHDVGEIDGIHFLTMPFIEGTPLTQFINPTRPLPAAEAVSLVRRIARAVAVVHEHGIIHRDLKPANVLVRADGEPIVMDFGLARSLDSSHRLTKSGVPVGTPMYMSPEQANGDLSVGAATDIYALGVILFELLTGRPPFDPKAPLLSLFKQILLDPPPPPTRLRPGLDPRFDALCRKALAKKPADRHRTMAEFAAALEALESANPMPGPGAASRDDRLICPRCGSRVKVPETMWDKPIKCSKCHGRLPALSSMPTQNPTPLPPRRPDDLPTAPARLVRPSVGRFRWMGPLLCVVAAVLGLGVLLAVGLGWFGFSRSERTEATSPTAKVSAPSDPPDKTAPLPARNADSPDPEPKPASPRNFTNSIGMPLVWVRPGTFRMGSPANDRLAEKEGPQHEVTISQGYFMGKYEVTQEEYERIMGVNPSFFSANGDGKDKVAGLDTRRFPVERVSWENAKEFCRLLSDQDEEKKHNRTYRLPTEAEWEYACRAGRTSIFHFGDTLASTQANFDGNNPYGNAPRGDWLDRTCTVGSYPANDFGLHDMHGNVDEWCLDGQRNYTANPVTDPVGPLDGARRVQRGGSWSYGAFDCRSANRDEYGPSGAYRNTGFRVVIAVPR